MWVYHGNLCHDSAIMWKSGVNSLILNCLNLYTVSFYTVLFNLITHIINNNTLLQLCNHWANYETHNMNNAISVDFSVYVIKYN